MSVNRSVRRLAPLALVAVVALIAALLVTTAPPALAQEGDQALDLDADDNVAIAIDWSELAFPDGVDEVLLGREDLFADNLASGGLQGGAVDDDGRPLLLTPGDALDERVTAELARLAPTTVHVLGGEEAIQPAVADELTDAGYTVNRIEGPTRIETAVAAAETVDSDTALLVRAFQSEGGDATQAFADTIAAAAWAAENGWAVLFSQSDVLTGSTRDHMETAEYSQVYVIGGTAAISEDVEAEADELADEVTRVEGETRFDTAVAIAAERGYETHADAGQSILVDGQSADAWADGFAAAAHAGDAGAPVVLANSATDSLPEPTATFLGGEDSLLPDLGTDGFAQDGEASDYVLICGPTAPDAQCQEAAEILEATVVADDDETPVEGDQDLTVTPTDEGEVQGEETREFSATELEDATTYTIGLIPAENVQVSEAGGEATFTATEDGTAEGLGETDATIPQVNGEDVETADDLQTAEPADGALTFTVGGDVYQEVAEVVFVDANEDGALNLDDDGTPVEDELYGVGGPTRILPPEGEGLVGLQDADILYVDYETGVFATADATYTPDEDDAIQVVEEADAPLNPPSPGPLGACDGSEDITVEELLAVLTVGDQLDGSSEAVADGADTLCLEDITPVAPTAAEEETSETSVTLTLTDINPDAVVSVHQAADPAEGEDPEADPANDEVLVGDAADSDPDTEGMQVVLEELTPDTEYHLYATQTLGPQESDPSNIVTSTTTAEE